MFYETKNLLRPSPFVEFCYCIIKKMLERYAPLACCSITPELAFASMKFSNVCSVGLTLFQIVIFRLLRSKTTVDTSRHQQTPALIITSCRRRQDL